MKTQLSLGASVAIALLSSVTATPVQAEDIALQQRELSPETMKNLCERFPANPRCKEYEFDAKEASMEEEATEVKEAQVEEAQVEEEAPNRKNGIALSPSVSTLGPGVELTKSINSRINARVGGNLLSADFNDSVSNIDYDADVNLESVSVMGDVYPWKKSGFHLTLGLAYNNNRVSGVGRMNGGSINLGGQTFQATDVGRVDADVSYSSPVAPFIGIGYGNPVSKNKDFGFYIRAGALITGAPSVDFRAVPNPSLPQAMQDEIRQGAAAEEAQIQDDLNNFPVYPVMSLGISYQF